ncbi:MAG: tetratricopeptide repeat protein [Longimicrobiales bacterium]|nr:tetratricopeptide repeat protein [Longimicrobiales bacterium]
MRRALCIAALPLILAACTEAPPPPAEEPAPQPEATSLLGEPLFAKEDTLGEIAAADSALAASPDDVELLIAAGRARRNSWHYREEMALYTRVIGMAPDDWRPYRFRGHRYISVREFDSAIRDMERARELAPMNWDVSYHLGLAYFVSGRFGDAADEYLRCLGLANDAAAKAADSEAFRSCSRNGSDPGSQVAMTEWAARALLRAGRQAEAEALAKAIPENLEVGENLSYYHDLLYAKGLKTADELLNLAPDAPYRLETVGYGVATRLLVAGDTARAMEVFQQIVADPWWPGFGRIAAEAELVRAAAPPAANP